MKLLTLRTIQNKLQKKMIFNLVKLYNKISSEKLSESRKSMFRFSVIKVSYLILNSLGRFFSRSKFQVSLKNFPEPACFDISARPGTEFNILKDESLGLTVTGKTAQNADEKVIYFTLDAN